MVKWTDRYPIDDVALMCDVASLGLQADFAHHLDKQPIKKTAAVVLAGAAIATHETHPQTPALSISLAAVAGLLALASLIKHMRLKKFAKNLRQAQRVQTELYDLQGMVNDLKKNPLPPAITMGQFTRQESRKAWRETKEQCRNVWQTSRQQTGYQK